MLLTRAVLHISGGGVLGAGWIGDHANWFFIPGVCLIAIGLIADWFGHGHAPN